MQVVEFVQRDLGHGKRKTAKVALQRSRISDGQSYDPKPSAPTPFSARPILTHQSSVPLSKD